MDEQFLRWLEGLGLGALAEPFRANDVDFETLRHLDDGDLRDLGLSLGHRRKLLAAIEQLDGERRRPPSGTAGAGLERRLLTVLFVDLVDSTALASQLDPEDLHDLIRRYQIAVTAAVVRYEGYVANLVGDGVVGYFGWPRAHEDEAERAVRAARDALGAVRTIGVADGEHLRARAGVATGEVVVGRLVSETTADEETAVGPTPNLADRLQRLAKPLEVVVDTTTKQLLGNTFGVRDLGTHELKGFAEPVRAWRLEEENAAESRFEVAHKGRLTRLVGRDQELARLRERWEVAKAGKGQVVTLLGEAGIGKSRLVKELRRELSDEPRVGLRYQCSPHHANSAFYPVIQQIRRTVGIFEAENAKARLDKIEMFVRLASEDPGTAVPLIASLLRVPTGSAYPPLEMPPQQARQRTIKCLVDQVLFLSRQHAVLVVVEDAHWADPSMLDYIDALIEAITEKRVLLLITYRTELGGQWSERSYLSSITLNRIGLRQATEISRQIGGSGLYETTIEEVVARADGVPLYVEELTKAVLETGETFSEGVDLVPMTLQNSLVARLDRLGEAKRVAQIGAVIGREFHHEMLAALAPEMGIELDSAVDRLVASGLVARSGVPPEATYTFKHALVQDAAYSTLLLRRRKDLHRLILQKLEGAAGDAGRENVDLLAHHALHAEDWARAFAYYREAGEDAIARSALREAVGQFKQALVAAHRLPESRTLFAQTIDVMFQLRNALWALGRFEEILTYLGDAERLSARLDDRARLGWVSVYRGASLWQVGRSAEAKASATQGRQIGESADDAALRVAANFYLGCAHVTSGECRTAEQYFEHVVDALPGESAKEKCGLPFAPSIIASSWLVWSYAERGEFGSAQKHADLAVQLAETLGVPFNRAHIYYDLGYFYIVRGDFDAAIETLEQALGLIEQWGLTYLSPFTMGFLGHGYVLAGQVERGLSLLEQASERYERIGLGLFRSLVGVQQAHAYLRAERLEGALLCIHRALEVSRARGELGHEAHGLRVLGEIVERSDRELAQRHYESALALAEKLEFAPLAAQCHLRLGCLLSAAGKPEGHQHLGKATAIAARIGLRHLTTKE